MCVYGLGLRLHVSVNAKMKFIMPKCIRSLSIHVNVEHKTHVNVKLCKSILSYVKQCKNMSLLFGGKGSGRGKIFKMFLVMGQSKWPNTKQKKKKP